MIPKAALGVDSKSAGRAHPCRLPVRRWDGPLEGYLTLRRTFRRLDAPGGIAAETFAGRGASGERRAAGRSRHQEEDEMKPWECSALPLPSPRWHLQLEGPNG